MIPHYERNTQWHRKLINCAEGAHIRIAVFTYHICVFFLSLGGVTLDFILLSWWQKKLKLFR